jgi:hypothetical protein
MPCSEGVHGERLERRETAETEGMCPTCPTAYLPAGDSDMEGAAVSERGDEAGCLVGAA